MTTIPFYFDDKIDLTKHNGIDKKFNHILYTNFNTKFSECFPNCILNDIIKINDTYKGKYFYPINLYYTLFHFLDQYEISIPTKVLNDLKEKKCKLLMMCIHEGNSLSQFDDLIDKKIIIPYNLQYSDIVIISGNLCKKSNRGLKNIYFNIWENIIEISNDDLFKKSLDNIFSDNLRNNKFICLQRRPTGQRLMLYTELYDYKSQGILSMGIGDIEDNFDQIYNSECDVFDEEILKKYREKNLRSTLPCFYDVNLTKENPNHDIRTEKFLDSYLHIVSETYFENQKDRMFFSEKIFKPMVFLQPFVIFGQTKSVENLQKLGFKTFQSKYINENYDNINDDRERFLAALQQVKNIISLEQNQLHDMMRSFSDILVHNYCHLKSRYFDNKFLYKELLNTMYQW